MKISNWFGYGADDHVKTVETIPNKAVLSLSGGGVRGITTLAVLAEVEKRVGKKAGDIFSLTAATSVGCILSSLLNLRSKEDPTVRQYSAKDLTEIMEPKIKTIFHQTFVNNVEAGYSLLAPKYTSEGMTVVLDELFGETKAKDLMGNYCFTSFNTTDFNNSYFPFTSQNALNNPLWNDLKVTDMLHAVTAAPTYFPPRKIFQYNIIDGGLLENTPCVRAYTEAKKVLGCGENMLLFSIGTGSTNFHLTETNWGSLHWGTWILPAMFSGQNSTAQALCEDLLNIEGKSKKFYNVQFDLSEGKDVLDDATDANMIYLKEVAKTWIDSDYGDSLLREACLKLEECR